MITAGPTREFIDPFRYISNPSSGKMGYALARAAKECGHEVTLISGPVELPPPEGVAVVPVVTALEMREAVRERFPDAQVVIMAAAVSDYRPEEKLDRKMKKAEEEITLKLIRNPDILEELGKEKGERLLVGFSAETDNLIDNAAQKLKTKNLDLVVANDLTVPDSGFASDDNRVVLLDRRGGVEEWPLLDKEEVARRLIGKIKEIIDEK